MTELLDVTGDQRDAGVERAAAVLRDAGLVVLPTDTVYGLAADAFSPQGTARLLAAKGRTPPHPLPVLLRSQKQVPAMTPLVSDALDRLVAAYWPGPLTIVVPMQTSLRWDLGPTDGAVAIRMPLDEVALAVIRAVGPMAVTSANRPGREAPGTATAAFDQLGEAVDLYLDDGPRPAELRSTVVDCTRRHPHILREGALPAAEVLAVARGELDPLDVPPQPDRDGPDAADDAAGGDPSPQGGEG